MPIRTAILGTLILAAGLAAGAVAVWLRTPAPKPAETTTLPALLSRVPVASREDAPTITATRPGSSTHLASASRTRNCSGPSTKLTSPDSPGARWTRWKPASRMTGWTALDTSGEGRAPPPHPRRGRRCW